MPIFTIYNVNCNAIYQFTAKLPLDAIKKMLDHLNLKKYDLNAAIVETKYGYLLKHNNEEYWIRNRGAL